MHERWELTIYDKPNRDRLVDLSGLRAEGDAVAVALALADAGYLTVVTVDNSTIALLVERVADGLVMVAGQKGRDLQDWEHPSWVRSFRKQARQQVGEPGT